MADEPKKEEEEKKEEAPKEEVKKEEKKEEPPKEEPKKEEKKKKEVKLTGSAKKILDEVKKLSVLEMADLVTAMEEEFGVSAAAPVAMAAVPGGAAGGAEGGGEEGGAKDSYTVEITAAGDKKIAVIKVVKEILGLGLKEAKDIVDAAPKPVKENVPTKEAEEIKAKLEAEGATVTLK